MDENQQRIPWYKRRPGWLWSCLLRSGMDENQQRIPWYKRRPGWLAPCLVNGAGLSWMLDIDGGDWNKRSLWFGIGFSFTLLAICFAE